MTDNDKEKHEKFKRILPGRLKNLSTALRRIKNLSHRYNYRFTEEEVNELFSGIRKSIDSVEKDFHKALEQVPVGELKRGKKPSVSTASPKPITVPLESIAKTDGDLRQSATPNLKEESETKAEEKVPADVEDEEIDFLKKKS